MVAADMPVRAIGLVRRRWSALARRSGGEWIALGAVVIGVVFGAFACADSMGRGLGHGAHGAVAPLAGPAGGAGIGSVVGHGPSPAHHGDTVQIASPATDGERSSAGAHTQNHPGMACAVTVELRISDPFVAAIASAVAPQQPAVLIGVVSGPDPPVPRSCAETTRLHHA